MVRGQARFRYSSLGKQKQMFEVGNLVTDKTMPGSSGIIIEIKSKKHKKSTITYITYLVHWFNTDFESTHGSDQLALIV